MEEKSEEGEKRVRHADIILIRQPKCQSSRAQSREKLHIRQRLD